MDIAVTAIAAWTAAGRGVEPLLDLLDSGGHAISDHPPYPWEGLSCPHAAAVPDLERDRPAETLLRTVVGDALAHARLPPTARVGLVVGTTSGDISGPWERWHRAQLAGQRPAEPEPGRDTPTHLVAAERGLRGPVATVSVACASGTSAFAVAAGWLADDLADAVVVTGLDALSLFIHAGFNGLGALSPSPSRPFSATRDGLTLGEGAAALVLEPAGRAPALAWLRGVGLASDAVHMSAPDREGRGATAAMRAAMAQAGLAADAVDMVSVHGTGTVFNDAMEAHALRALFGDRPVAFHGIKHAVGHTMGAAGAVEAAVVVAALRRGRQPPPYQVPEDLPLLPPPDPPPVPQVALSTSSAFGGSNAALVLALRPGTPPRRPTTVQVAARIALEVPAGRVSWSDLWPDAPDRFKRANRYVRTGLLAVARLVDALGAPPGPETGIVLASPSNCRVVDLRYHERLVQRGAAQASRLDFVHTIPGAPAGEASILWGLRGPPLFLVGPAEQAEAEARRLLRWGRATRLVALGIDAPDGQEPARATACLLEAAP